MSRAAASGGAQPHAANEKSAGHGFAEDLIAWQRCHGRHDLPWQNTRDPYRIWLSEIMLQQTQVTTVIPYYAKFLARFPDVASLAAADLDEVLRLWSGLGYYSRGRNLHRAAGEVMARFGGAFPRTRQELETLPGIGRSTAAAIAAFAFGRREAILDGNVKRVLARCFAVDGHPAERAVSDRLWQLAESLLPGQASEGHQGNEGFALDIEAYTQGLMDIGATLCGRKPECGRCPLAARCAAHLAAQEARYPAPRPRKAVVTRQVRMLVLLHDGRVLLERRPPAGVWASLWCLPELAAGEDAAARCAAAWGLRPEAIRPLAALRHALTHFTMDITATLVTVAGPGHLAKSGEERWVEIAEAETWALPAPIKSLLRLLAGTGSERQAALQI